MATKSISRRDILKTLTMGAVASSVLRVIPAQAAEYAAPHGGGGKSRD